MITIKAPVDKPVTISTKFGISFTLPPGATRRVPNYVAPIAAALGCFVVEEAVEPAPPADPKGDERSAKIAEAVATIAEAGDESQLTGDGVPRTAAVKELTGFSVKAEEIAAAVESLNQSGD